MIPWNNLLDISDVPPNMIYTYIGYFDYRHFHHSTQFIGILQYKTVIFLDNFLFINFLETFFSDFEHQINYFNRFFRQNTIVKYYQVKNLNW